ncbi:MAG: D-alanyl-D-alanine carboxypeptidase [Ruminococcaceae bacterium]|nr:D-alanyl-D-alanine carboxypeptidase [Oscillospiraceae bacterium]
MKKTAVILSLLLCLLLLPADLFVAQAAQTIYLKSETAVLMEASTGAVLFDKNMNRQMYPASITKVMTAMLALENSDNGELLTASHNAVYSLPYNTSHIALGEGEQLTMENALYALGIESANDAANVIAEHIGGSTENFAQLMTQKARNIGAFNTNFTNPHGLPDNSHYTTAYDMALITAAALKTDGITDYFSTNRYDMPPTNTRDVVRQFWNANYYINGYEECEGLLMSKTGWTEEAQHTMVTVAKRGNVTLVAVVMSSQHKGDKFDDTTALLDYGFANYDTITLESDAVKELLPLSLNASNGTTLNVSRDSYLAGNFDVTVPKGKTAADVQIKTGAAVFNEANDFATVDVELFCTGSSGSYRCGSGEVSLVMAAAEPEKQGFDFAALAQKAVLILLAVVLWLIVGLLVFIALKQLIIIENRRRMRKKRQAMLRAKRQKEQQEKAVYRK